MASPSEATSETIKIKVKVKVKVKKKIINGLIDEGNNKK